MSSSQTWNNHFTFQSLVVNSDLQKESNLNKRVFIPTALLIQKITVLIDYIDSCVKQHSSQGLFNQINTGKYPEAINFWERCSNPQIRTGNDPLIPRSWYVHFIPLIAQSNHYRCSWVSSVFFSVKSPIHSCPFWQGESFNRLYSHDFRSIIICKLMRLFNKIK